MVVRDKLTCDRFLLVPLLHKNIHSANGNCKTLKGNKIMILTVKSDERILPK
jgi:hypothetical protein